MPVFVGRSAGLVTQPSTHQLKFQSPVPANPMVIPAFIQREVAPLHHTHSHGDITGAGGGLSAARQLFFSVGPETPVPGRGGDSTFFACRLEIRDGHSNVVPEQYWFRHYRAASAQTGGTSVNGALLQGFSQDANSGVVVVAPAGILQNDHEGFTHSANAQATWYWLHNVLKKEWFAVHVGGMFAVTSAQWNGT